MYANHANFAGDSLSIPDTRIGNLQIYNIFITVTQELYQHDFESINIHEVYNYFALAPGFISKKLKTELNHHQGVSLSPLLFLKRLCEI